MAAVTIAVILEVPAYNQSQDANSHHHPPVNRSLPWVHVTAVCCVKLGLLSLGLGWPGPLQGLRDLKIQPPPYLWACKSCTRSRQSLTVTQSQGSRVQAG